MSLGRLLRTLRIRRELNAALRLRKADRQVRSARAHKGHATAIRNRVFQHQAMWGK